MHRLNALSITDDLIRAELYRRVREGQSNPEWTEYTTDDTDRLRPEGIAYKVYGVDFTALKWIVCIAAGLDDWRDELEPNITIRLPSAAWIRKQIRELNQTERKLA